MFSISPSPPLDLPPPSESVVPDTHFRQIFISITPFTSIRSSHFQQTSFHHTLYHKQTFRQTPTSSDLYCVSFTP